METEETHFLRAIRAEPNEDFPRLVYADWLEENGQAERAEFIRIQCAIAAGTDDDPKRLALTHRENRLWRRFGPIWRAQLPQIAIPFMGLPGLTVSTGLVGRIPVGVQIVSGRYREDLCLAAGEAIEAGGVPPSPIDPASSPSP